MGKAGVNLSGAEGYFVFHFGWIHCLADKDTGLLPPRLQCRPWDLGPGGGREWEARAQRIIAQLEHSQATGDLDRVSAHLPAIEELADRLDARARRLGRLAERARTVSARHEPSAGHRRQA